MLSINMLSVIMLSVIMLSVVMLNVVAPSQPSRMSALCESGTPSNIRLSRKGCQGKPLAYYEHSLLLHEAS
jgi:hypothetical protein